MLEVRLSEVGDAVRDLRLHRSDSVRQREKRSDVGGEGRLAAYDPHLFVHLRDVVGDMADILCCWAERIKLQEFHVAIERRIEIGRQRLSLQACAAGPQPLKDRRGGMARGGRA